MRLLRYLFLFACVAFIVWPYYHVYRLDNALGKNDMRTLEQLLDIPAIRRNYKERLKGGLSLPQPRPQGADSPLAWLQQNLRRLGDAALEQAITLPWARDTLKEATAQATDERPPYFMAAITFAFFESYDRFLIRLGELGKNATHIRMTLQDKTWQITDIIR
ncbi:DUF2939 domain-containing protein [Candidatus Thiosymbion oneisti]|uniref:DUF2939 domain-containing protein n=1 Tax=Candidatus Thiosymbion oneisti TaxID=589554 RepID=UPI000B7EDCDD|nr:DUF2939 domain-containing protein [Candidatus Thiosymbion oneisti]